MSNKLLVSVVNSLRPSFFDAMEYGRSEDYWENYDLELDYILNSSNPASDGVIVYINHIMARYYSSSAEHHACTDVATTLHGIDPVKYNFKFK